MGFKHRVYRHRRPAPTMKTGAVRDGQRWLDIYQVLAAEMSATGILPNLDFPTGPAYYSGWDSTSPASPRR